MTSLPFLKITYSFFFDRESSALTKENKDPLIQWNRWKKEAIDAQTKTAHGAERYIKSGRSIFLDTELAVRFPLEFDPQKVMVRKIIIAHGAKEACKNFSDDNVYGSLGMFYVNGTPDLPFPFMIHMDKENPVHVFDSHNLHNPHFLQSHGSSP